MPNRFAPLFVGAVNEPEHDVCGVSIEVIVDSAAEESVCPVDWAQQFNLEPLPPNRQISLEMNFQVTDVMKPLLAVSRLIERPRPGDSFIQSVSTGDKLQLERRGNSWIIPGQLARAGGF